MGNHKQSKDGSSVTILNEQNDDQVGKAEDVQDLISIISPSDCPMYTAIRPQKVHARVYEYQQDTLN